MALPVNYDTVPIRGRYVYLDGRPAAGFIRFTGKVTAVSDATDTIILPATIAAALDANGEFVVEVPATDDPDIQPNGWTYTVTEQLANGGGRTYDIDVPLSAKAAGIDLSEVAPAAPASGSPTAFVTLTKFDELKAELSGMETTFIKSVVCLPPTVSSFPIWKASKACNVVAVTAIREGGTGVTLNAAVNGTNVLPAELSLTTPDTWLTNNTPAPVPVVAGQTISVSLVSVTGAPTSVTVEIEFSEA